MLYTPHAVTGATIAYMFPNPLIAIPLSIVSHLFFDVTPHANPNPHKVKGTVKLIMFLEIIIGNIILFLFSKYISGGNIPLMTLMILSGVAANLPDILTGPYAILKKDILFSRKIAEFQHLIQNHVSAFFGYSLQLVFLGIIIFVFLNKAQPTF